MHKDVFAFLVLVIALLAGLALKLFSNNTIEADSAYFIGLVAGSLTIYLGTKVKSCE